MPQRQPERKLTPLAEVITHILERVVVVEEPTPCPTLPDVDPIRTEPELGRICVGGYKGSEFRLWTVARHITRQADGSGRVSKRRLRAILGQFGVSYTRQHLNRLLKAGDGVFWNLSKRSLHLRTPRIITAKLIAQFPKLAATNRPGVRDVYLSPAGSLEQWEAMIYIGWMTHREAPTISREELERLFNRDQNTLRRWEQSRLSGLIDVRTNYAQADPKKIAFTPPPHSQDI